MDYQQWLEQFRSLINTLKARSGIDVRYAIGPPTDDEDMRISEAHIARRSGSKDFRVPSPLREFFRVTSGFDFTWVWRTPPLPHNALAGAFNMTTLGGLFDPIEEEDQYIPEDLGAGFSLYGQFRTFDNLGPESHVLAKFSEGATEPQLFWHTIKDGIEHLSLLQIGFDQYLEYALAACCLFPWQLLFVEDASLFSPEQKEQFFTRLDLLAPLGNKTLLQNAARTK